jgi:hypothetical protein
VIVALENMLCMYSKQWELLGRLQRVHLVANQRAVALQDRIGILCGDLNLQMAIKRSNDLRSRTPRLDAATPRLATGESPALDGLGQAQFTPLRTPTEGCSEEGLAHEAVAAAAAVESIITCLHEMTGLMLPPATGIPDRAAQVIAYQSGVLDLVCELLDDLSRQRRPIAVLSPAISDTVHGFLQALCQSNKSNQEVVFKRCFKFVLSRRAIRTVNLAYNAPAAQTVYAALLNNRQVCSQVSEAVIRLIIDAITSAMMTFEAHTDGRSLPNADEIGEESDANAIPHTSLLAAQTLLSCLQALVVSQNHALRNNQQIIFKKLESVKTQDERMLRLWLGDAGHRERRAQMESYKALLKDAETLPQAEACRSEALYHTAVVRTLALCAFGQNWYIQKRCRLMIGLDEVEQVRALSLLVVAPRGTLNHDKGYAVTTWGACNRIKVRYSSNCNEPTA